jgi:hypothetical protein
VKVKGKAKAKGNVQVVVKVRAIARTSEMMGTSAVLALVTPHCERHCTALHRTVPNLYAISSTHHVIQVWA